jgi:hypothetical protein
MARAGFLSDEGAALGRVWLEAAIQSARSQPGGCIPGHSANRVAATHSPSSVSSSSRPLWIGIEPGLGLETSILTRLREMQVQAQGPLLCGMGSCEDTGRSKSRGQGQGRRCGEVFWSLRASTASGAPVFVLALALLP